MRNILFIFVLLVFALSAKAQWYYGAGKAVNLENDIGYQKNSQLIKSGVTIDPKITATSGGAGSLIMKTDGSLYIKTDSGSSTNWRKFLDDSFDVIAAVSQGTINYLNFNTAYSPTHVDGRVHYDSVDKTLSVDIDSANGVELQVGQESYVRVVNKTGAPITDGSVVYISGAQGNRPTVALALGSDALAGKTMGVATQNIGDNAEGMVTISGTVGGFNTSSFTAGDRLYLSSSVAGALTNIKPSAPNYAVPIGWALNSTVSGKILVDIRSTHKVGDLNDVTLNSLKNGDTLVYSNGVWKNNPNTTVVGSASSFYLDDTTAFADNFSLQTTPSSYPQSVDVAATTATSTPAFLERYVSGPLGRASIPAGTWTFKIYCTSSNLTGINKVKFRVNKRVALTGMTGTFTGSGPTRTFTVTGGTPFVAGDANANRLLANLIETPTQTGWISGFTSSSQVTVTLTDPAFVNVSNVPLSAMYYYLFNAETGDIGSTTTPELQTVNSVQPAFNGFNMTDRLVLALFGSTDQAGSRNISLYHGGTVNYSNFSAPLSTLHNDLASIQGGTVGEYYHLTQAKYNAVENLAASGTQTNFTGGTQIPISSYSYYGDSVTDGSIRTYQSGGALITEKRISGSWTEIFRLDNL